MRIACGTFAVTQKGSAVDTEIWRSISVFASRSARLSSPRGSQTKYESGWLTKGSAPRTSRQPPAAAAHPGVSALQNCATVPSSIQAQISELTSEGVFHVVARIARSISGR